MDLVDAFKESLGTKDVPRGKMILKEKRFKPERTTILNHLFSLKRGIETCSGTSPEYEIRRSSSPSAVRCNTYHRCTKRVIDPEGPR